MFRHGSGRALLVCVAAGACAAPLARVAFGQRRARGRVDVAAKIHPSMEHELERAGTGGTVRAWVLFRSDKGLETTAARKAAIAHVRQTYNARAIERRRLRRTRPGLFDLADVPVPQSYVDRVKATGASVHIVSRWVNGASVRATRAQLQQLATLPFVDKIQPVRRGRRVKPVEVHPVREARGRAQDGPTTAGGFYGESLEQLTQINLVALHDQGFTAAGVRVGILDTGFQRTHVAFNEPGHVVSVINEYDFVDDDPVTSIEPGDPSSQHSHGTMILGTLGAYRPGELVGAAYDASFILCKTEDITDEYPGEEDNYVAGLEFIEANGGDMATSSLGYIDWYTQADLDGLTAVTTIAVNVATGNGVYCCTAAGNSGHDGSAATSHLIAPADALQVLTCGAVANDGSIAGFSSDGPTADGRVKPEVLARGVDTRTVSPWNDTLYQGASGTSLSTPLVAGAVACLIQAHPTWTVDQMRNHLFETADYFVANGTFDPLYVLGYGVIDAAAASALGCDNNTPCDDGVFCNGDDFCWNDQCVLHTGNPCPDFCDPATDQCVQCLVDAHCDDGMFCNGDEVCVAGVCQPAASPRDCSDGIACTVDSCNEATDACEHTPDDRLCSDGLPCTVDTCDALLDCQHVPDDSVCDDGAFCNGAERCNAVLGCQQGFEPNCDDGIDCTIDSCDETADRCDHTPDDSVCDNGVFCDGAEMCSPEQGCLAGDDPCPGGMCDESADLCVECMTDADCDDGLFCNGLETCAGQTCVPGADPCPDKVCVEQTQECVPCETDGDCDDANPCNGTEACVNTDCVPGTPIECDDGDPCNGIEACDPQTGDCGPAPVTDCNGNGIEDLCDLTQCDGAPACSDCNGNAVPDQCDILFNGAADVNGNGVPDTCETACGGPDACDDRNVCTFDACVAELCWNTNAAYADIAAFGGAPAPDGTVDIFDIFAVLDGFSCDAAGGSCTHNADLASEAVACTPDGHIDIFDIFAVLDAFQGLEDCCVARP